MRLNYLKNFTLLASRRHFHGLSSKHIGRTNEVWVLCQSFSLITSNQKKKKKVKRKSEFNVKAKSRKVNPISDFDNHKPLHIQLFVFIPNEEKKKTLLNAPIANCVLWSVEVYENLWFNGRILSSPSPPTSAQKWDGWNFRKDRSHKRTTCSDLSWMPTTQMVL